MKKEILRIVILLLCLPVCLVGEIQGMPDSVVMTVAGKPIPLSEFIFIAQKNGEADFTNKKSVDEYVELFKNFKLKVADAEAQGLDKTKAFATELAEYKKQLVTGYLSDKAAEEAAAKVVYDRGNEVLDLSYILFLLPPGNTTMKDTVAPYQRAMDAYSRLTKGEDIDVLGKELHEKDAEKVIYEHVSNLMPMRAPRELDEAFYNLPTGEYSLPIHTSHGFYVAKVHHRRPNPGLVRIAHILIEFPEKASEKDKEETLSRAEEVYKKIQDGEDFGKLAKAYSSDSETADADGLIRPFGIGETVLFLEKAAFALTNPGDVSPVLETSYGYHIIKLIEKKPRPSFDVEKRRITEAMMNNGRRIDLQKSFDDRLKREYEYTFYPEAYKELEALCQDYFPTDSDFQAKAKEMKKTLFSLTGEEFTQAYFATYMAIQPMSQKKYGPDYMQDLYNFLLHELLFNAEQQHFQQKNPEYTYLMQEYRDGILLFEVSNQRIWNKPMDQQAAAEAEWLKELEEKYPVVINEKVIKKLLK